MIKLYNKTNQLANLKMTGILSRWMYCTYYIFFHNRGSVGRIRILGNFRAVLINVFTANLLENNNFWLLGWIKSWQKIYLHLHWHTFIFCVIQLYTLCSPHSFYLYSTVFVWSSVCTSLLSCDWLLVSVSTNQNNTAKLPAVSPDRPTDNSLLEWTAVVAGQSADQFYENIFNSFSVGLFGSNTTVPSLVMQLTWGVCGVVWCGVIHTSLNRQQTWRLLKVIRHC